MSEVPLYGSVNFGVEKRAGSPPPLVCCLSLHPFHFMAYAVPFEPALVFLRIRVYLVIYDSR
jgi:hypothetical protein